MATFSVLSFGRLVSAQPFADALANRSAYRAALPPEAIGDERSVLDVLRADAFNVFLADSLFIDARTSVFDVLSGASTVFGAPVQPYQIVCHLPNNSALTNRASLIR